MRRIVPFIAALSVLLSCSKAHVQTTSVPEVIVFLPVTGLGDEGYNDLCYSELLDIGEKNKDVMSMSFETVRDADELARMIDVIEREKAAAPRMLYILCSPEYDPESIPVTASGHDILLFESEEAVKGCHTFSIDMTSAAYRAGEMLAKAGNLGGMQLFKPAVLYLEQENPTGKAFASGFIAASGEQCLSYCVSDFAEDGISTETVYSTAIQIYQTHNFVLPQVGEFINGIYHYSRESSAWMAGVDADGENFSPFAIFSLKRRIDKALDDWTGRWLRGENIPDHIIYYEDAGFSELHINPDYEDFLNDENL